MGNRAGVLRVDGQGDAGREKRGSVMSRGMNYEWGEKTFLRKDGIKVDDVDLGGSIDGGSCLGKQGGGSR